MEVERFRSAEAFLERTRAELELNEAANSLMLGLCGVLIDHPGWYEETPCLSTVTDARGLVLAALMTPPHNLIVYHHQGYLKLGAALLIESLLGEGWQVPGIIGARETSTVMAEMWAARTGSRCRVAQRLRVYKLREVAIPPPQQGRLRLAKEEDVDLVARWHCAFQYDVHGRADEERARRVTRTRIREGDIYLWEDGQVVSVAMKNRPTRHGISVGLVYTPPELRGRGYATACAGELSRLLLDSGWEFCALFADLENPISNHVYLRIGYEPVCDFHETRFEEQG